MLGGVVLMSGFTFAEVSACSYVRVSLHARWLEIVSFAIPLTPILPPSLSHTTHRDAQTRQRMVLTLS